ncbi:MAG: Stp1/IreP family PP2C-type Ser/Thr phosphatase [Clostridia bacterium]|nr:Stp1/IreP family PP2C-type Ser/Thr phosphatase [Clostridia bacterium]
MKLAGITDIGKVRQNNEDNLAFNELENAAYFIVCDGMGGVEGGEIASEIAVKTISEQIENAFSSKMKPAAIERMLISAVTAANYKIYEYAQNNDLQGMGTTAVTAVLKDDTLIIAYDGDSRAYLIDGNIEQITTDHTYVNELYRLGEITHEEMQIDPRKNIITRALGVSEEIETETLMLDVAPGAKILLCSDGLTNCLSDEAICDIVMSNEIEKAAELLIEKANENGGIDNITVGLIENEEA